MINLKQVTVNDKNLLWNVLQKYLYEMTQFYPDDVMDEQGNYSYKYFDAYFTEPNRKAYFIYLDDDFIGFAMINSNSYIDQHPDYVLAEYTIFPGYRGLGNFAFNAAQEIFWELPGKWELKFLETNEVAKRGVFLSFQSPEEISGISVFNFLKTCKAKTQEEPIDLVTMRQEVSENMAKLEILPGMEKRDLNVGFSGGEKKKNEILQLLTLSPKLAILDETDSGLDVDAIKIVSNGIRMFKNENNAVLIITHSTKILEYLDVDYVHILIDGKIVYTGKGDLASQIEKNGYESFKLESKNGTN